VNLQSTVPEILQKQKSHVLWGFAARIISQAKISFHPQNLSFDHTHLSHKQHTKREFFKFDFLDGAIRDEK
jgi:hypothetical protein